jgi:hypothetical protein
MISEVSDISLGVIFKQFHTVIMGLDNSRRET